MIARINTWAKTMPLTKPRQALTTVIRQPELHTGYSVDGEEIIVQMYDRETEDVTVVTMRKTTHCTCSKFLNDRPCKHVFHVAANMAACLSLCHALLTRPQDLPM